MTVPVALRTNVNDDRGRLVGCDVAIFLVVAPAAFTCLRAALRDLSIPILVGVIRALLATILNGAFVSVPATR